MLISFTLKIISPICHISLAMLSAWFSLARLMCSYSLLHNIISNRTGVNAHFFHTENNLSNFCVNIKENKVETFHF